MSRRAECWGVILAGGDGTRLRPLTRLIAGDERPKQFCPILGAETLLGMTRRRTALEVAPDRTLLVVTRTHERFYAPLLADVSPGCLVVQPESRGTAPAILYALLRVGRLAPTAPVAIVPSDHYVSDDATFMAHVAAAFEAVLARPDLIILLGITPDSPEVEYGWIEPADRIPLEGPGQVYRVRRFWEKPPLALAQALLTSGCLWNSFLMVGRVPAFLALIRGAVPHLYDALVRILPLLGSDREPEAVTASYAALPAVNFSRAALATRPANLAVLPVSGIEWSDWGDPRRVLATLGRLRMDPEWARDPAAAAVARAM